MNRKYNNNNKGNKKEQMKETNVSTPEQVSGLMSVGLPDGDSLYTVCAAQVDIGGTATTPELFHRHVVIGDPFSSAIDGVGSLISSTLEELIDAYATARGYVTSVTAAKVEDYVEYSYQYFATIMHLLRAQNGSQLKTDQGFNLGSHLGSKPQATVGMGSVANFIGDAGATTVSVNYDGDISISNKDWSSKYISELVHVKLSRGQVQFAVAMFGSHYLANSGGTGITTFIPSNVVSTTATTTQLENLAGQMAALRAADKDLIDIVNFLGFTNELVLAFDYTRDVRGLTVDLKADPNIESALYNAFVPLASISSDSDMDIFWNYFGTFSPLNYADDANLDASVLFNSLILRGRISDHLQIYEFISGNTAPTPRFYFPMPILPDGGTITTFSAAQYSRLIGVLEKTFMAPFEKLPVQGFAYIQEIAPGDYGIYTAITGGVAEGYNAYALNDSWDYYVSAKTADILMGDTQWREAIQNLSNKIRTVAVSRKA